MPKSPFRAAPLRATAVAQLGLLLILTSLFLATPASEAQAVNAPAPLSFDQIFAPDRPGRWPAQIAWHPGGEQLTFLLPTAEEGKTRLVAFHATTGAETPWFESKELPSGKIDRYVHTPAGDAVLLVSGGDLFWFERATGKARRLTETAGIEEGATLSPDGKRVAFSRDANLYVLDVATGKEKALTRDGKPDAILNAVCDWVYWEEIWNRNATAFWWSPDGKRIVYYRFDLSPVATYPLVDYDPVYPEVRWQKYPKAGAANPKVELRVVEVGSGKVTPLQLADVPDAYLARVHWVAASGRIAVERLNRDQTKLEMLLCNPAKGSCEQIYLENYPTWLNLSDDTHFLADGSFLRTSEASGFRHIYHHGADGKVIRQLTFGNWAVTSVDGVDEAGGWVYFTGFSAPAAGGTHRRGFRIKLDGTAPAPLTVDQGWSQMLFSPDLSHYVHTYSQANLPTIRTVVRVDGTRLATLPTGPKSAIEPSQLPQWEQVIIWALDGTKLSGRLLRPKKLEPNRRYPAIIYHYGGPGSQTVTNRWDGNARDLWHRLMADRGFVIFMVDNTTTAIYGKKGEDAVYRAFGNHNLEALVAGVEYLKSLRYVDTENIGLWGWSGGGTNTLMALLTKPGLFKAGVAGAPVTDWRLYDSIWTERYLDTPESNPDGYQASSPVSLAKNLKDGLLLVHGTFDDNVHPQNATVLAKAFIEAGVPFEEAYYPEATHAIAGKNERHFYERMTSFFERWLKP